MDVSSLKSQSLQLGSVVNFCLYNIHKCGIVFIYTNPIPQLHFFFFSFTQHIHLVLPFFLSDRCLTLQQFGINNGILGLPKARIWYIWATFPKFLQVAMVDNWVLWFLLLHFIYTVVASGYHSRVEASSCDRHLRAHDEKMFLHQNVYSPGKTMDGRRSWM